MRDNAPRRDYLTLADLRTETLSSSVSPAAGAAATTSPGSLKNTRHETARYQARPRQLPEGAIAKQP
jgi:hypothetical protein